MRPSGISSIIIKMEAYDDDITDPKSAPEGSSRDAFMSADELRQYSTQVEMARASKEVDSMDLAGKARADLIKRLIDADQGDAGNRRAVARTAEERRRQRQKRTGGDALSSRLCTDRGRAVNNSEPGWPDTLTGVPRQAFELWRNELQPAGYRLKAMIVEWPKGLPGDVGLILAWGDEKLR